MGIGLKIKIKVHFAKGDRRFQIQDWFPVNGRLATAAGNLREIDSDHIIRT